MSAVGAGCCKGIVVGSVVEIGAQEVAGERWNVEVAQMLHALPFVILFVVLALVEGLVGMACMMMLWLGVLAAASAG